MDQLWVADITYIRLKAEFVYLAVILDAFSRKVVGWALDRTLVARLAIAALERAIGDRKPLPGLVHHSDRGIQYACCEYVGLLASNGMTPSMSRPANPYDNASCESFMKTLKREEVYATEYRDLDHLQKNIAEFIENYYNRIRLHSSLGYRSPEEFEQISSPASPAGATMSFFRHREICRSDVVSTVVSNRNGEPAETGSPDHRLDESPAGYSLAGCSPVLGCCSRQGWQGTGAIMGTPRPAGSRPSYALVLERARFSSVVPGCVVKTVVTEACFDRPPIPFRRLPDFHNPDGRLSAESVEGICHGRPRARRPPPFCQCCIRTRPGWTLEQPRSM
jgi:hypothetical protein